MIAKKMLQRQDVIRVCMESNTIAPGDRFTDVVNDDLLRKVDGAKLTGILCFGPVNENEMLFCAGVPAKSCKIRRLTSACG